MTNDDVKKISDVVRQQISGALKPVNDKLDKHTAILNKHTAILGQHGKKLDNHTAILQQHGKKLDNHTAILQQHGVKLDNHTASLVKIEQTLETYADMYKVNKEK